MDHAQPLILAKHIRSQQLREEAPQILLYLKFFCKTMLPINGARDPKPPKSGVPRLFSSSILCKTMVLRICKTMGIMTETCHFTHRFWRFCKTMLPILCQ